MLQIAMVKTFSQIQLADIQLVGGKNASLGEMINNLSTKGVLVPDGFAITTDGFKYFLKYNNLSQKISEIVNQIDIQDLTNLKNNAAKIRELILNAKMPDDLVGQISSAYNNLKTYDDITFAVRSSATAEDLVDASFAGQQESYLHIKGLDSILDTTKKVFASLYNDRALSYRKLKGFGEDVYISVGVQQMVRSDLASSGVMFSLDTESGFRDAVFITSAYGLGEMVVQGEVDPDEFYVSKQALKNNKSAIISKHLGAKSHKMIYNSDNKLEIVDVDNNSRIKFSLNNEQIQSLADYALIIENHYQRPMDIEWGLDGIDNKLYILQARPETVRSTENITHSIENYTLNTTSKVITTGRAIGQKIIGGRAKVIPSINDIHQVEAGDIIITEMTDPNWEVVMKIAGGLITNRGGRTCHAAIIARELGLPAIVGTTNATQAIENNNEITLACADSDEGQVYQGILDFSVNKQDISHMPELGVDIMLNVGNPHLAFSKSFIPNSGVGLARLEFIINNYIGVHPQALLDYKTLDTELQQQIQPKIVAYLSPEDFYVEKLVEGIAQIAAAFYPKPVIVRTSDFKSNEYANLIGGKNYEPNEENPMLGFRGVARYLADDFKKCFELECKALKIVREQMGFENVKIMLPFVRTLSQADEITQLLANNGLRRGENNLELIMMCEVPSNVILADKFLDYFDGFSIGSNDLTQLTLGLDRDSDLVAKDFDERDEAVKTMLKLAIDACKQRGKYVGICGQAPSDYPELAQWLMEQKISSISLNPDSAIDTWLKLANN
jgi:pyruvate,water dikinase